MKTTISLFSVPLSRCLVTAFLCSSLRASAALSFLCSGSALPAGVAVGADHSRRIKKREPEEDIEREYQRDRSDEAVSKKTRSSSRSSERQTQEDGKKTRDKSQITKTSKDQEPRFGDLLPPSMHAASLDDRTRVLLPSTLLVIPRQLLLLHTLLPPPVVV